MNYNAGIASAEPDEHNQDHSERSDERDFRSYVILASAQKELRNIVRYLAEDCDAPNAARAFLDGFSSSVDRARRFPESYLLSSMDELARRGYRVMLVGHYVVLYAHRDGMIVIAHVFHQRQDYAKLVIAAD